MILIKWFVKKMEFLRSTFTHLFNKAFICFPLLGITVQIAYAQTSEIEEVTVWGTQVSASSIGLDESAIAVRQADHVSDLLRTIPGVDVGGAHSLNQRITIRSMDDKDLRISINGANQNTYMYHHMGNLQIHADILKSVAINVGRNSVADGGLGGTVRFETKEASDLLKANQDFGARVQAGYANNASSSIAFTAFGQISPDLDALFYYNTVDRDNYEVGGGQILDASGVEIPGTGGEVRGLKGDLADALFSLGWNLGESQRLSFSYETYVDEGNYSYRPDMGLATDLAIADNLNIPLVYPTEFTRDTLTINYRADIAANTTVRATVFGNTSTLWRDERGLAAWRPPFATVNEGEATNSGANLIGETILSAGQDHTLLYGFEHIDYDTEYSVDGSAQSGEGATTTALFVEDRIDINQRFSITPGIRYETYDLSTTVVDSSFANTNLAIAAEYLFSDNWLFRVSSTQIFKGPEIGEVFIGAGLFDTPNSAIEAEEGSNTELGLAYQGERIAFGATAFRTDIDNYIYDYAPNPAGGNWKDNIGDMSLEGYEAYVEFSTESLTALLSYANAESELAAYPDYSALNDARIDRQQGGTFSLNLDYRFSATNLAIHWDSLIVDEVAAGPDLDGATFNNQKDSYTVHNVSLRWTPRGPQDGLALTVGIDNVLDEFFASQSSRTGVSFHPLFGQLYLLDYEPGRNFKTTLSYQF